jgi:hypothetical protein
MRVLSSKQYSKADIQDLMVGSKHLKDQQDILVHN